MFIVSPSCSTQTISTLSDQGQGLKRAEGAEEARRPGEDHGDAAGGAGPEERRDQAPEGAGRREGAPHGDRLKVEIIGWTEIVGRMCGVDAVWGGERRVLVWGGTFVLGGSL